MSYSADQLIVLASNFEALASEFLEKNANDKDEDFMKYLDEQYGYSHEHYSKLKPEAKKHLREMYEGEKSGNIVYHKRAADKSKPKLDPKAKVRNRGTVCVPASSAKDKKDHFPINSEAQARNALARVHQYSSVPAWYSGSLKSLQELVSRKVHSKYKGIGKSEKKKSATLEISETLLSKYS